MQISDTQPLLNPIYGRALIHDVMSRTGPLCGPTCYAGPSIDMTKTVSQPEAHFSTPLCPYKTGRLSFVVVWWWHQLAEPNFPEYERASSHVQPPHLRLLARGSFCSGGRRKRESRNLTAAQKMEVAVAAAGEPASPSF